MRNNRTSCGTMLIMAFLIVMVILSLFCAIAYGDKPITEVPAWAYWLMNFLSCPKHWVKL